MTDQLSQAQRNEIIRKARADLAAERKLNGTQTRYIETDIASTQTELAALRSELEALKAYVETLARTVASLAEDVIDARSFVRKGLPAVQAPQARGEVVWWQWVNRRLEELTEELHEDVGTALGEKARELCEEFHQYADGQKREIGMLRRELATLTNGPA